MTVPAADTSPPPSSAETPPGRLTRRVLHILNSTAHGSPSAPVSCGPEHLPAQLTDMFRRATERRIHTNHTPKATKGTA